ncbi:MAG: helix-turn-helix domain-containing protein [Verrucomicrobia bacterium]|nr:helix-turn-helix domain-containing protein [Verrucomicrobiota bacterium]
MSPPHDFLTVAEVATLLRLSQYAVRDMAKRGEIPANKIGHVWRIPRSEFDRYLERSFNQKTAKE